MLEPTSSLADLARSHPSATRVLLRHRLDFCCGGRRSLTTACAAAGLDAQEILRELEAEVQPTDAPPWNDMPLAELANHIESHYHAALRRDLPPLVEAARKVERVHAGKPDVPAGLAELLSDFYADMEQHMRKEEQVLFPMIRRGGRGQSVYMPVRIMEQEHETHGETLAQIRSLTGDLQIPANACATWTALYNGLLHVEEDLMQHIHLENNVLFQRATAQKG